MASKIVEAVGKDATETSAAIRRLVDALRVLDSASQLLMALPGSDSPLVVPEPGSEEQHRSAQVELSDGRLALASAAYDLFDAHTERVEEVIRVLEAELSARASSTAAKTPRRRGAPQQRQRSESVSSPVVASPHRLDVGVDPAEPRYCVCGQVAFGEMLMCSNELCPAEWFHFPCVGIHPGNKPAGDWLCPICRGEKERGRVIREARETAREWVRQTMEPVTAVPTARRKRSRSTTAQAAPRVTSRSKTKQGKSATTSDTTTARASKRGRSPAAATRGASLPKRSKR
jgi:hypothetical protein